MRVGSHVRRSLRLNARRKSVRGIRRGPAVEHVREAAVGIRLRILQIGEAERVRHEVLRAEARREDGRQVRPATLPA